jgi:hypothetical protein
VATENAELPTMNLNDLPVQHQSQQDAEQYASQQSRSDE